MAYVNNETTSKIRQALKNEFPDVKFSVRKCSSHSLNVSIMASPFFDDGARLNVNKYWISEHFEGEQAKFLEQVDQIIRDAGNHYDNSDVQTDYFECAFYYHIEVGQYNKPHVRKG